MRRTQAYKSRNHVATVGIGYRFRHSLGFGGIANQAQLITQPLDSSAGNENRAFECIFYLAVYTPGNSCNKTVFAVYRLFTGIHQHKTARTIGIFCFAGCKAGLSEQRTLLIACSAGDRNRCLKQLGIGRTVYAAGRLNLRQHLARNAQNRQDFVIPLQSMNIKHQCTGSIGIIRNMNLTAGQLPDNPAVDSTKQQLACFRPLACTRYVFQNPVQLGTGEISIQNQACLFTEHIGIATDFQQITVFRGTTALPDNRLADRTTGVLVPNYGSFALVRNTDAGNISRSNIQLAHCLVHQAYLGSPDFLGIVLHPACLRIILRKLLLCYAADLSLLVKQNTTAAGSSQIQCHDIFIFHAFTTFP